jgi:Transferrin receptor-like dimerisation domain
LERKFWGIALRKDQSKLRELNDRLIMAERAFIDGQGLSGREWHKHLVLFPYFFVIILLPFHESLILPQHNITHVDCCTSLESAQVLMQVYRPKILNYCNVVFSQVETGTILILFFFFPKY